jgi:NTP pyrophosphatase (non-canonical NTP hydrolase)
MEINEAKKKVDDYIMGYGGYWESLSMMARITEENGEIARAMNIKYGGKKSKGDSDGREIERELADVFFTVLAIANKEGVDLEKAFMEKLGIYYERDADTYGSESE